MDNLTEVITSRGNTGLYYKNFLFRKFRVVGNGEDMWRCAKKSCKAILRTVGVTSESRIITIFPGDHNHAEEAEQKMLTNIISSSVKRKAEDPLYDRSKKIVLSVLQESKIKFTTPIINNVKQRMYNHARKTMPKLPKDTKCGNMAGENHEIILADLNKLKKSDLINIILHRRIPSGTIASFVTSHYIENVLHSVEKKEDFYNTVNDSGVNDKQNLKVVNQCLAADLRVAEISIASQRRIISELEKRNTNLETIISLLQGNNN